VGGEYYFLLLHKMNFRVSFQEGGTRNVVSLRHAHLASFFLDPEDIRRLSAGAIWNFATGTGLL